MRTLAMIVGLTVLSGLAIGEAAALSRCEVGMAVKGDMNYPGTIVAVDPVKGSYQVRMDKDGATLWMSSKALKSNFSCEGTGGEPKNAAFFEGAWDVFVPSAPTDVDSTTNVQEIGPGGKAPPLTIRNDGTYSWQTDSQTVIEGQWRELGPDELRQFSTGPAILLMKGEGGQDYQLWAPGDVTHADNRDIATLDPPKGVGGVSMHLTRLP
jgi:hypothetical protein